MAMEIESRLPLARATEVGSWVESLARESLVRRAAEVTPVESASDVEMVPAEPESVGSAPSGSAPRSGVAVASKPAEPGPPDRRPTIPEPSVGAGESTGSTASVVSSSLSISPGPKRRSRRTAAVVGAGAAVVGVLVWVAIAMRSSSPSPEAAKPPPSDLATVAPQAGSPPPAAAASSSAAGPASAAAPVTAAIEGAKPPSRPSRPAHGTPTSAPPATKSPSLGSLLDTRR